MHYLKKLVIGLMWAGASTASFADAIDDYIQSEMQRQNTPGLAFGIIQSGVLVRAQGYGYANLEHRVQVHPDTVFQSASVGKQFTAAAVMLMVEDGKLDLDQSIRKYLPDAPKAWQPITPRHMLTHTSGMNRSNDMDLRKDYTDEELLSVMYRAKLDFAPGQRWSYSNTAYIVLGLLINKVSGEFYGDVLKKRLFAPLGMHTASVIDDRGIVPNRAAGYVENDDGTLRNQDWIAPTANSTADGSLQLTVLDYAKWEAGLHAGKILKPESLAQVMQPARLNSGKPYSYGFGWRLTTQDGRPVSEHAGRWQGFTTYFVRYLGEDVAVVALANGSSATPWTIARHVAGLYNPKLALPAGAPIEDTEPQVTQKLRSILEHNEIAPGQRADFDPQLLEYAPSMYQKRRATLGQLRELGLFAVKDLGDDRDYLYRARFESGIFDVSYLLGPGGKVLRFGLTPVTSWEVPVQP